MCTAAHAQRIKIENCEYTRYRHDRFGRPIKISIQNPKKTAQKLVGVMECAHGNRDWDRGQERYIIISVYTQKLRFRKFMMQKGNKCQVTTSLTRTETQTENK